MGNGRDVRDGGRGVMCVWWDVRALGRRRVMGVVWMWCGFLSVLWEVVGGRLWGGGWQWLRLWRYLG